MGDLIERLREVARDEDERVRLVIMASGLEPILYTGSKTGELMREAAAALEAAREDVARLDWLGLGEDRTCYVGMDDRWTVQDGMNMVGGDTLRAAIDQARGKGVDGG